MNHRQRKKQFKKKYGMTPAQARWQEKTQESQMIFAVMQRGEMMDDVISRKAAEAGLYGGNLGQYLDGVFDGDFKMLRRAVVRMLESLPTAQQERTARWSQVSGQAALCSCCGRASNAKQARNWSYCQYCGAKMEEMK